jgi:hypothetical protein
MRSWWIRKGRIPMDPAFPFPGAARVSRPKRHNSLIFRQLLTKSAIFETQQRISLSTRIGLEKSGKFMSEIDESSGEMLYFVFIQKYKDHTRLFSLQDHVSFADMLLGTARRPGATARPDRNGRKENGEPKKDGSAKKGDRPWVDRVLHTKPLFGPAQASVRSRTQYNSTGERFPSSTLRIRARSSPRVSTRRSQICESISWNRSIDQA